MTTDDAYFDLHYDRVCTAVWETWTKNGLGLDEDDCYQTMQSVRDAVTNAYVAGGNDT
jgi:hypothetical protein